MSNWNLKLRIAQVCGTQIVFSELVGCSELNVSRVVCGRKQITAKEMHRWAKVLQRDVCDLFDLEVVEK